VGKYIVIGAGGYGAYVSLDNVMLVQPDSRNPLSVIDIYYTSGKKLTITLNTSVVAADQYKLLNFFVDRIINDENPSPVGMNWVSNDSKSIGGSRSKTTGQYSSELPFNDVRGNSIQITSITVS